MRAQAIKRLQTPVPQTETNGGYIDARSLSRSAMKWTGLAEDYRLNLSKNYSDVADATRNF